MYDLDLVLLSIKLFYDLSLKQKNKDEAGNPSQEENYKEWLSKINKKNAQERIDSVFDEVFPSSLDGFKVTLSEYDKFDLVVEKLYVLPKEHDYLVKFRQAKDILDAGYMSDRLKDAQKMFREIYTVSVIPEKRKEDFSNAVREFLKNHPNEKWLYTSFKREVLSKFVVSLPRNAKQQSVEGWVRDLSDLEDTQRRRLLRWCRDIYFAEYEYNHEQGIIVGAPWGYNDAAIL